MAPGTEEKRRFPRVKLKASLCYKIRGTAECNNSVTDDISLGGVGFINHNFIPPETSVGLEINILSKMLNPIGKIAWSQPLPHSNRYRVGVEFLEFDPREKNYLSDYINLQQDKL